MLGESSELKVYSAFVCLMSLWYKLYYVSEVPVKMFDRGDKWYGVCSVEGLF